MNGAGEFQESTIEPISRSGKNLHLFIDSEHVDKSLGKRRCGSGEGHFQPVTMSFLTRSLKTECRHASAMYWMAKLKPAIKFSIR